jgi:hypothetical protein
MFSVHSNLPEVRWVPQLVHVRVRGAVQRPRDDRGDAGGEGGTRPPHGLGRRALPGHGRPHGLQLPGRGLPEARPQRQG